jgi:phosphate transport system protein
MTRKSFDQELTRLQDEVLSLSETVEKALIQAVNALMNRDRQMATTLIAADRAINEKRFAIEGDALTLIATQQPLAGDLRTIFTTVEIATELERIADYAKGIAKVSLMIADRPLLEPCAHFPQVATKVRDMLHDAILAFVSRDAALARSMPEREREVDELHNQVHQELLALIATDPSTSNRATQLFWVIRNLERAADRVLNICERVVFNITGEMVEMDVEEGEIVGPEGLS